ncbi:MAG TPA: WG repeat-containing protein [Candidatus Coprenecus stercoravium]|uniref:WG repeat-containing protein n=1 Tax=Candidatus Coprenecus stercoravium TaxID=2840735 RepID=A0A9D2GPA4_9BACT|nr:WG repeat-containing protein [Candidatus Coprenecus stercoravium]
MRNFRQAAVTALIMTAAVMTANAQSLMPYRDWFGSYGFTDSVGNIVIECRFDDVKAFSEGYAPVLSRGGDIIGEGGVFGTLSPTLKWGYIDTSGIIVIPCRFDIANRFSEGYAAVMSGNKWGFIDHYGDTLVNYKYDEVKDFVNGYAAVRRSQQWGYIDTGGQETVPCIYDVAGSFGTDGFAAVTKADSSGFVFRNGDWYANKDRALDWIRGIPFSIYAKDKMMNLMNEWQRRQSDETVADWEARVNEETFMARLEGLEMRSEAEYLAANQLEAPQYTLGTYDTAAAAFNVTVSDVTGRSFHIDLPVPVQDTATVSTVWKRAKARLRYFVDRDRASIAEAVFTLPGKRVYTWLNARDTGRHGLLLDYNLENMDFSIPGKIYRQMRSCEGDSAAVDTDYGIPQAKGRNKDTYAIIIANGQYRTGETVPYAANDGNTFYQYCLRRLGIPRDNIKMVIDAASSDMRSIESWLERTSRLFSVDSRVIVYFAGLCDEDDGLKEPYLLPVDYSTGGVQGGISLRRLYTSLLHSAMDNALFLIDASYGETGRDGMRSDLFNNTAPGISELQPEERMVVFYGADETSGAYPYPQKRHGLFTYFLLKALQNNPEISYGALFDYINANVRQTSESLYGEEQRPEVYSSEWDGEAWRDFSL